MQLRRHSITLLLPILVLGMMCTAPAAATDDGTGAVQTDFWGLYFPAGMPGTGTDCPYEWVDPAFCVIEAGSWQTLPSGRIRIRDMVVFELALAWNDDGVEPRKTGYDIVVANANLDESLTGPTWGTWTLYSPDDTLMFAGKFSGKFENGIPAVHFVGRGVGSYEGEHMSGEVGRIPDPFNMFGRIVEPPAQV